MRLSVIIPVYNEVRTLTTVLDAVRRVPIDKEIIVIDGQSTDGTQQVLFCQAEKGDVRAVFQKERNGRGGALREGMELATGDVIVFQDADLELDPACFPDLLAPIASGQADIVFGSRFLKGKPDMTPLQYLGNRVVTETCNLLWNARLSDVETCYQMFRREAIHGLEFDRSDMSFTVELALRLLRTRRRVAEVSVGYNPRGADEGKKLYWGDGFISLWVLVRYRIVFWLEDLIGPRKN